MAEKEREARRMHEEAVRVGNHADKLKRDRARSLQEIESKLRFVIFLTSSADILFLGKQLHIHGCIHDISTSMSASSTIEIFQLSQSQQIGWTSSISRVSTG